MSLLATSRWRGKIYTDTWTDGSAGTIDVREPATGLSLGMVGAAGPADALAAARRASQAQKDWAGLRPEQRAAVLRRAGQLFEDHAEEINSWIVRETGAIQPKAQLETHIAANECFEAAGLPSHPAGEVLASNEDRWSFARRRPAGVVSVISPFNFPLILSIRSVAPALALGNAVLLKPDPRTCVSGGVAIMRVFEEAGLPAGVLQFLPGGSDVGQALVEAPEVRIISFTGSTPAGRKVGETAGRLLKRAHLELGGNNALIVLPGANLEMAASAGAFGSFMHQGQICMSTGRHLVHESLVEEYVERLSRKAEQLPVGDPHAGAVALGPIIDERQRDNIDRLVRAAKDAGADIAAGGTYENLFYRPTVLMNFDTDNPAWCEEIFGPVAPVMSFTTVSQAVELANASDYGLSVGILGEVGLALEVADLMTSGKIHINEQTVSDEANAPFGGVGSSGTGSRFGGAAANIEAFTETQWLTVRPRIAVYPF